MRYALILSLAVAATGCHKKVDAKNLDQPGPERTVQAAKTVDRDAVEAKLQENFEKVYFAYDSAELTPKAQAALEANAKILAKHTNARIVVEGHCDQRGSAEYNLALGNRRAKAATNYITKAGVPAKHIDVVSYGKDRPAVQGTGESAWSQNRRVEFTVSWDDAVAASDL